jgi:hypothetical protein
MVLGLRGRRAKLDGVISGWHVSLTGGARMSEGNANYMSGKRVEFESG